MRSTEEWIGDHDDQAIPARVRVRTFDRYGGKCALCTRIIAGSLSPAYDHITALINGGQHREGNLQLLCVLCHAGKTKADVALKSKNYRVRAKHLGVMPARQKIKSAGFRKSAPQRTASRPLKRSIDVNQI